MSDNYKSVECLDDSFGQRTNFIAFCIEMLHRSVKQLLGLTVPQQFEAMMSTKMLAMTPARGNEFASLRANQ